MKKLISIDELRVGMYVCGLGRAWIETPFFSHSFLVSGRETIEKLRSAKIGQLYIDTERGIDDPPAPGPSAAAQPDDGEFMAVSLSSLKPGTVLPFDVFRNSGSGRELTIEKGSEYSAPLSKAVKFGGSLTAFIRKDDEEAYLLYSDSLRHGPGGIIFYTQKEFSRYNRDKEIHYPISRELLSAGTRVDFSILVKRGFFYAPLLMVERGSEAAVTERDLQAHGEFVIVQEDIQRYQDYIARRLRQSGNDQKMAAAVTRETAKVRVREILGSYRDGRLVKKCVEDTVQEMLALITSSQGAFAGLLSLNAQDTYTYVHSVNVAALSISLGNAIGLGQGELFELGMGCILHDIGKVMVPVEILNKPSRLTIQEYKEIKKHVLYGRDILNGYGDIPEGAYIPVLQHHEKLSGKGYPFRLSGADLHDMGRIASMVDTYDAITTSRPYRKALSAYYALKVISSENENYAPALYSEFVKLLGRA